MSFHPRRCLALLFLAVPTLAIGCSVQSRQPLSNPDQSVVDEALLGAWRLQLPAEEEGAEVFLHVGRTNAGREKSGVLRCLAIFHNVGQGLPPADNAELFTTEIGDRRILNLKWLTESGTGNYSFSKYEVTDDQLRLYPMKKQPVVDAIEKGELDGTVSWAVVSRSVTLHDSSDSLFKFVASHDDETLFKTSTNLVFDRISN